MQSQLLLMFNRVQKIGTLGCRVLQKVLVFLIFILFFVFAYAYLQFLFLPHPHHDPISDGAKMGYLGVGLWLFYNLVYNYVMANIVGPGTSSDIPPQLLHHHQVLKKCKKCRNPKPIRTHHCSICDKCILQMDHHCPWMGVCIGHNNRRYFIRFLLYLDLACFLVVALVVREHLPRAEVYMFMLTIGIIIGVFGLYHWWIVLRGRTTLQFCEILDGYKPSNSVLTNFTIVFGTTNIVLALLPIYIPLVYKGCEWDQPSTNTLQLDQSSFVRALPVESP